MQYLVFNVCLFVVLLLMPSVFGNPIDNEQLLYDSIVQIVQIGAVMCHVCYSILNDRNRSRTFVCRERRCVSDIFQELGPRYTRRSYRMNSIDFWTLYNIILPYYPKRELINENKRVNKKRKRKSIPPNGEIHTSLRLSIALRYFAGGSPYDLMSSHGVGHNDIYNSVWGIVDAVNQCPKLQISYPTSHEKQKEIAGKFANKSDIGFDNCAGCIDGILIWTNKPTKPVLEDANLGSKKFFCGRKKRFGMNMQAICDDKRRFLDIDIAHPASTSDYLAFGTSDICKDLETRGFLSQGLSLYGDNAYMNTPYMTTPFKAVSSGPKDAFNFYHSQIRINMECAFGMLVNRWGVLHTPIAINISIKKTTSMVRCLCCLHNFLIDQKDGTRVPESTAEDCVAIGSRGGSTMRHLDLSGKLNIDDNRLFELDGCAHNDDSTYSDRYNYQRRLACTYNFMAPRDYLMNKIGVLGLTNRPQPMGSTTTN